MRPDLAYPEQWNTTNSPERISDAEIEQRRNLELLLPKIAARYTGRLELIHHPAVTQTIEEEQAVKSPVELIYEQDAGPVWWLWLVLGASVLLGVLPRFGLDGGFPIEWLGLLGGGIFLGLRRRFRTLRRRTVTEHRETCQKVPREIVVKPKSVEERLLPGHLEVAAIGRLSLPFMVLSSCQGTLLLARETATESCEQMEYPEIKDAEGLVIALEELDEKISRFPHVLCPDHDPPDNPPADPEFQGTGLLGMERELRSSYLKLAQLARRINYTTFRFAPVPADHPLIPMLRPVSRTWPDELFLQGRDLEEKLHGDKGVALDRMLTEAPRVWAEKQRLMHAARRISLNDGMAPLCRQIAQMFEFSAFNFYCPTCAADQHGDAWKRDYSVCAGSEHSPLFLLPDTRCVYDPNRENWHCLGCGGETLFPIPVHRMLDEVMLPAYDRLIEENKNERLGIYAHAREQEHRYRNQLEAEVEELFRKNREAVENLQTEKQHHEAEVQGELRALSSLKELRLNFEADQGLAIRKIFAEQTGIQQFLDEERSRVHGSLDQINEGHRRWIQGRFSQLNRAEFVERKTRDELLVSINRCLMRLEETGEAYPRGGGDGEGARTETSAGMAPGFGDSCAPMANSSRQCSPIAAATQRPLASEDRSCFS